MSASALETSCADCFTSRRKELELPATNSMEHWDVVRCWDNIAALVQQEEGLAVHLHSEGAGHLSSASAIDDGVVAHEVAGDAEVSIQAALDLVQHHLVAAAHKDGHRSAVGAVFNNQHAVFGGAER